MLSWISVRGGRASSSSCPAAPTPQPVLFCYALFLGPRDQPTLPSPSLVPCTGQTGGTIPRLKQLRWMVPFERLSCRTTFSGPQVHGAGVGCVCVGGRFWSQLFQKSPKVEGVEQAIFNRLGLRAMGVFSRLMTGRDHVSKVVLPQTPDRIRSILRTQPGMAEAEPSRLSLLRPSCGLSQ